MYTVRSTRVLRAVISRRDCSHPLGSTSACYVQIPDFSAQDDTTWKSVTEYDGHVYALGTYTQSSSIGDMVLSSTTHWVLAVAPIDGNLAQDASWELHAIGSVSSSMETVATVPAKAYLRRGSLIRGPS